MNSKLKQEWPALLVYAILGVSLLTILYVDFRYGAVMLATSILTACLLRWALPDAKAGYLRVRRRRVDLTVLATLGIALLILALVVPRPR